MLEFSSTESCTTSNTSTPLVGFSSNDSSCDGNVALMNDFESTGGCSGQGPQGPDGFSAYQIAVFNGFVGTEEEWLASLVGPQGIPGTDGTDGVGVPPGGTAGQILTKIDSTNYNTFWQDNYADWTSVVKHIVKNDGTGLILKGTPVYVTGSNGTNMLVGKASNISEATSSKTMGLMQTDITTTGGTQTGFVITEGLLAGLNTAGRTAGEPIWLGPNGTLIYGLINKPYAPAHLVFIGIVTKVSAGNGEVFVKVQNGFELKEIHDVDVITTTPVNGDVLGFNGSLWVNKTIPNWLGYTPFNLPTLTSGSVLFSDGTTIAQNNANFFWNNANNRLGIGTTTPSYALHVNGVTGATTFTIPSYNSQLNQNYLMLYGGYGAGMQGTYNNPTGGDLTFGTFINSIFNEKMRLLPSGNLGIGETSPLTTLDIRTSSNSPITPLASVPNASTTVLIGNTGTNGVLAIGHNNTGQAWLQARSRLANTVANSLLINPLGGNVGIGITTPQQILDVYSTSNYQGILVRGSVAPSIGFVRNAGTASEWKIGISGNFGSNLAISSGTVATDVMTFGASGVGIGVTNATSKLDILDTVLAGSAALAGSVLNIAQTWNTTGVPTALLLNVTDTASNGSSKLFDFQVGGLSQLTLFKDGRVQMKSNTALNSAGNSVILRTNLGGGSGYNVDVASYNTFNTSNSPQGFISLGGSIAYPLGTGVFKGINVTYTINNPGVQTGTATGIFLNATETALNGMVHSLMDLQLNGVSAFRVTKFGELLSSGYLKVASAVSIGWAGGKSQMFSPSDGVITLNNNASTDFGRLQLGGTTNLFPSIKRNGAALNFKLADDSDYCAIRAATGTFYNVNSIGGTVSATSIAATNYRDINAVKSYLVVTPTTAEMRFETTGLFADSGTINASARVQIDSTTQGFLPPRMTTAQKVGIATPATGLVVFDTDLGKLCVFAVTWQTITSV